MWNLYMNRVLIQSSARAHASVSQLRPNATYSFQVRPSAVCLPAVIPVATLRCDYAALRCDYAALRCMTSFTRGHCIASAIRNASRRHVAATVPYEILHVS